MKKILGIFVAVLICTSSFASGSSSVLPSSKPSKLNAAEVLIPMGKTGQKISLLDLSRMSVKEFESVSGHKMNLSDKIKFKLGQRQLAKNINADNTINTKKLTSLKPAKKATEKSHHYLRIWLLLLLLSIALTILGIFVPFLFILASIAGLGALIFFILWIIELSK